MPAFPSSGPLLCIPAMESGTISGTGGISMQYKEKSALPLIESAYADMTQTEKTVAAWFLAANEPQDPSLKAMARLLSSNLAQQ